MTNSIAVDKVQKRGARSSITRLDLTREVDRTVLDSWLDSNLLVWVHLAPVCGTASRAREIRVHPTDPKPLRSSDYPDGLPNLEANDALRVQIANLLFDVARKVFDKASRRGILVTLENPRNSHFWATSFFISLWKKTDLFCSDFQVCMYGGDRDKWTRIVANFKQIQQLDIVCNRSHNRAPWRFSRDATGKQVWATALESQYPRKLCWALCQCVLQVAQIHGLVLLPESLTELDHHPLLSHQKSQIAVGSQPSSKKLPPMVPDYSSVLKACLQDLAQVPVQLLAKLPADIQLTSVEAQPIKVPKASRFLRFYTPSDSIKGGDVQEPEESMSGADLSLYPMRAVFGLPWSPEDFIRKAAELGHPAKAELSVPQVLERAIKQNLVWNDEQLTKYRADWCRQWPNRAKQVEVQELEDRTKRSVHVQQSTKNKRLILAEEILKSIEYPDLEALDILRKGSTLPGDIARCPVFDDQFRPCLMTLKQLEKGAAKRNQAVLAMTTSSGDVETDLTLLQETRAELSKGWARGPFKLQDLPEGAVISSSLWCSQTRLA